jgi:hypothetical protein
MNAWFTERRLVPKVALDGMLAKRAWDQRTAAISARE